MTHGTGAQKRRAAELILNADKPAMCRTGASVGLPALGITRPYGVLSQISHDGEYQGIACFMGEAGTGS